MPGKKWIILAVAVVYGLSAIPTWAQTKIEFYRGTVPVVSQTREERRRASKEALAQVLVRMSGSQRVRDNPVLVSSLNKASNYIEQFQYMALESEALREQGYRESLSVSFSEAVVKRLLREAQLPFWSENRPTTLVLLVEDHTENGKQLLNQRSESPAIQALLESADQLGLPLLFPLLDLEDQLTLDPENVWRVDNAAIADTLKRYKADAVLVGRFSTTSRDELWSIWQFFHRGTTINYDGRVSLEDENLLDTLGKDALTPLAKLLAERYALQPKSTGASRLVLQLNGVKNFSDYRKSLDYLTNLAAVSGVQIAAVRSDSMLLYIDSQANAERLLSVISLENRLRPVVSNQADGPVWQQAPRGSLENPLRFIWSS